MTFAINFAKFAATAWLSLFLFREYPGNLSNGQQAGFCYLVMFGALLYFMAPYIDVLALMSRRGSEASPNSTSEVFWKYLGLFGIMLGLVFWVTRQVW